MSRKPTEIVQLTLRLREDLRKRLERAADKAERSLNIEIVERLEASFTAEEKARDQQQLFASVATTIGTEIARQLTAGVKTPTMSHTQVIDILKRAKEEGK